jgi:hypothetical protein
MAIENGEEGGENSNQYGISVISAMASAEKLMAA